MSWFFANPTTFLNGNSETVTNNPMNLGLLDTHIPTTATPLGTSLPLFAIRLVFSIAIADKHLYYPDETARDTDLALLEAQLAVPNAGAAGTFTATPASFVNGSSQTITNLQFNLDQLVTFDKITSKPLATSESLPAIKMFFASAVKYLYYPDTTTRDADYVLIKTAVGNVGMTTPHLVFTPSVEAIAGSSSGAWVVRTLALGANKTFQAKISRVLGPLSITCGIRNIGSSESPITIGNAAFYKIVQTDGSSNVEIYSNSTDTAFTAIEIIEIEQ